MMRVVLYTNSISAHQLPLAREIAKRVGEENFRYIYTGQLQGGAQEVSAAEPWILKDADSTQQWLEYCDLLLTTNRALPLFERRATRGLRTYYQSERWFKPMNIGLGEKCKCSLPGWTRLLVPNYRRMAKGFVRWLNTDPNARYLAIGPWAKKDMLKLGVKPEKIHDWGYFVEPSNKLKSRVEVEDRRDSTLQLGLHTSTNIVKVLYVGRLLKLKHVDTIIRAIAHLNSKSTPTPSTYTLTIVGDGPEKSHLQKLASTVDLLSRPTFSFLPPVPIHEVRPLMRQHDILVFASDANDGWGAVVSEALSEGVPVIGTYETGASAALLSDNQLFHCGDYRELAKKLSSVHLHLSPSPLIPVDYTPSGAAQRLLPQKEQNA